MCYCDCCLLLVAVLERARAHEGCGGWGVQHRAVLRSGICWGVMSEELSEGYATTYIIYD